MGRPLPSQQPVRRGYGYAPREPHQWNAADYASAQQDYQGSYAQQVYSQYGMAAAYVPPATSVPPEEKRKKRGVAFWVGIAVAIAALITAGVLAWFMLSGAQPSNRAGSLGQLEGKSPAEIQAEIDRVVEEGMFNISIASVVQFPSGTAEGELRIENVPNNPYLMRVVIVCDDTGEQVYESGILEPNYHIQSDVLDVALPKGSYRCTATFHALDPNTEEEVGTAGAQMLIEVLS